MIIIRAAGAIFKQKVNLSTPRPEGWGLLEVHPEPRFFTPHLKAGLRAAEWVKSYSNNLSSPLIS
jgi:hypothetical protein